MELDLKIQPPVPVYNNAAGRLLSLLDLINAKANINSIDRATEIFGGNNSSSPDFKSYAYFKMMQLLMIAHQDFIRELEDADNIPNSTRASIAEVEHSLGRAIFPNPNGQPQNISDRHRAMIEVIASLITEEKSIEPDDLEKIRLAIEAMRKEVESADIPNSIRKSLFEIIRIARNAVDLYSIRGARGFKKATKKMIAELIEIYDDAGKDVTKTDWWAATQNVIVKIGEIARTLKEYVPLIELAGKLFSTKSNLPPQ